MRSKRNALRDTNAIWSRVGYSLAPQLSSLGLSFHQQIVSSGQTLLGPY